MLKYMQILARSSLSFALASLAPAGNACADAHAPSLRGIYEPFLRVRNIIEACIILHRFDHYANKRYSLYSAHIHNRPATDDIIYLCDSHVTMFCPCVQSYGGYMAGMFGSSGAGVYSTAISQSPVTDWHYYGE